MPVYCSHRPRDSSLGVRRQRRALPSFTAQLHRARGQYHAEFFPRDVERAGGADSGVRDQRRQLTQCREMRLTEALGRPTHAGIDGQLLEVLRLVPERHAAIALAMFMAALEAVPGV